MPIFTFSTKNTRPADTEAIREAKKLCARNGLNFSALVVRLVQDWLIQQENNDAKPER